MKASTVSFAFVLAAAVLSAPAFSAPVATAKASVLTSGSATSNDIIYRKERKKNDCVCSTDSGAASEAGNTCC